MPHTVQYRPILIDQLISTNRIASYSRVFSTQNDAELVGAYLWNSHVCSALYPLLSAAEVTLRNSIDAALTADLGKIWWKKGKLQYKSFALGAAKAPRPVEYLANNFSSAFNTAKKSDQTAQAKLTTPASQTITRLSQKQSSRRGNSSLMMNTWGIT